MFGRAYVSVAAVLCRHNLIFIARDSRRRSRRVVVVVIQSDFDKKKFACSRESSE